MMDIKKCSKCEYLFFDKDLRAFQCLFNNCKFFKKMIYVKKKIKTQPELRKETVEAIERARKRIKSDNFVTEKGARERLSF